MRIRNISNSVIQLPQLKQQASSLKFFQNCTVVNLDFALDAELLKAVYKSTMKKITGSLVSLKARPSDTILSLKQKIRDTEGIPLANQRLVFKGRELFDGRKLYESNIFDGAYVDLLLRSAGSN